MNLQELKDKIREDSEEYKAVIEAIAEAAIEKKKRWLDFNDEQLPDAVYHRLIEDGYKIKHNKYASDQYRVYGWAGDVEEN